MPLGTSRTEQGSGADVLQRPLRSRFRTRLTAGVRQHVRLRMKNGEDLWRNSRQGLQEQLLGCTWRLSGVPLLGVQQR
jgi:hypothetical protein